MKFDYREIIDTFNSNNSIISVIETCTNTTIKGKSLPCPIHGGANKNGASVDIAKNIFTCWTADCGRGLTPWNFIKKYFGLTNFKDIAKKCNTLFNANIPILEKSTATEVKKEYKFQKPQLKFNKTLVLSQKYITKEIQNELFELLKQYKGMVFQANTGMGKNHSVTHFIKDLDVDYTFILTPTRALVEDVASNYKHFKKFYGTDVRLPQSKYIVATFNKARAINSELYYITKRNATAGLAPPRIAVVIDETHELLLKRNLLGTYNITQLENLIKNADYKLFMSANTSNFIKAYANDNIYNLTVNIESKEINYNADNLYIYRCSTKPTIRLKQIFDKIIENLGQHEHIFISIDSKKDLQTLSNTLTQNGVENVVINSENREEEDILEDYLSIVKNNKLSTIVVLCTSIINAGNNIINENVLTISYQSKMQFNLEKIEQLFGRIRTDKNNNILLFLDFGEPLKYIAYSMDRFLERNNIQCKMLANDFNYYWFNKYGVEDKTADLEKEFNLFRENDKYRYYKNCFYVENNILKIDAKAIYNLSNLEWQKFNYFNNEFIIEMLKDIKVRKINTPITLTTNEKIEETETLKITIIEPLNVLLDKIKTDDYALEELFFYLRGDIKSKHFQHPYNVNMYNQYKQNKIYREFVKNSKIIFKALEALELESLVGLKLEIFSDILDIYTKKTDKDTPIGKTERDRLLTKLKRIKIYNIAFPLNTDLTDIEIIGDISYCKIRRLDKVCISRNKLNNTHLQTILVEILKEQGAKYLPQNVDFKEYNKLFNKKIKTREEQEFLNEVDRNILTKNVACIWYSKKGKKIDFQMQLEALEQLVLQIYNCSNSLKMYSLNT